MLENITNESKNYLTQILNTITAEQVRYREIGYNSLLLMLIEGLSYDDSRKIIAQWEHQYTRYVSYIEQHGILAKVNHAAQLIDFQLRKDGL